MTGRIQLPTRIRVAALLATYVLVGWVIADAVGVVMPGESSVPILSELTGLDEAAALARLREIPVASVTGADFVATCLLHEQTTLHQAARTTAHERLDQWQLSSNRYQRELIHRLAGSLRREIDKAPQPVVPNDAAKEIASRVLRMAQRPGFEDRESCMNDCRVVLMGRALK